MHSMVYIALAGDLHYIMKRIQIKYVNSYQHLTGLSDTKIVSA